MKQGDTLYKISRLYDITENDIIKSNNLVNNILYIGQKLIIPTKEKTYIVKKGDTLYKISKENNTTIENLIKTNNLESEKLKIDQKLIIK